MIQRANNDTTWGILSLWYNWMLGYGVLTLLILLSLWIRPLYMPFVAFGLQLFIFVLIRRNRARRVPECYILPFIVSRVLFWTGVAMVIINYIHVTGNAEHLFSGINPSIPFITVLITAPLTSLICGWGYFTRGRLNFCRDCRMRNGGPAERGFLGKLYTQEGLYQVGTLFTISVLVTVASWSYYFLLYINISLTPLDEFFYVWLRVLLWLVSTLYLAFRYMGILGYYRQNVEGSLLRHGRSTRVRFILINNDRIAMQKPETDPDRKVDLDEKLDTPAQVYLPHRESVSLPEAEEQVVAITKIHPPVDVRLMYSNLVGNADCNIFHFLCFLNDSQRDEISRANKRVVWKDLREIANAINLHMAAPLFSAEIVRLHTVAMAWKTYDADGRRRYPIKHYTPPFRIADIKNWDVDYDNPHWIYVSDNNEDSHFYQIRRLWRKYINGIGQ